MGWRHETPAGGADGAPFMTPRWMDAEEDDDDDDVIFCFVVVVVGDIIGMC
jgi:hypothetical protein